MIDADVVNDRLNRSQIGDQMVADYHQECLLCRCAIHRGDTIKAAARNVFSESLLWYHPRCGDFILLMHGREMRYVDNGWRQAQYDQRCYNCRTMVRTGNLIYRMPRWTDLNDPLTMVMEWVCTYCHSHVTAPRLDKP